MDGSDLDYVEEACSVYCRGPVLEAVQLAGIFNDSKTFVDMPMLEVSAAWLQLQLMGAVEGCLMCVWGCRCYHCCAAGP